jgi:hypothetical protein
MRSDDLHSLPKGLPVPTDDGDRRQTVVYAYLSRTGRPDVDADPGFDAIPGARVFGLSTQSTRCSLPTRTRVG